MTTKHKPHPSTSSIEDNHLKEDSACVNSKVIAGFPALAVERIRGAQRLNKITIYLVMLALLIFLVFGTLASFANFRDNETIYILFHYVPYGLVALAIPLLLYQAFVVSRYRLCQPSMLIITIGGGLILLVICLIFTLSNWLWIAISTWIGVAYWFKATFKRFFVYINDQT